tara:strand:- start:162 stop:803 length:642 start_codon:yes stop_codon:yes gene_type:complete
MPDPVPNEQVPGGGPDPDDLANLMPSDDELMNLMEEELLQPSDISFDPDTATASAGMSDTFADPAITSEDRIVNFLKSEDNKDITRVGLADQQASYGMVGDKVMDVAATQATKTASDIVSAGGSTKNVTDIVGTLSKAEDVANLAKGASTAMAGVGTAIGVHDLATNWNEMSDSDKAAKSLTTAGGIASMIPGGAIFGVPATILGSLWDAFND